MVSMMSDKLIFCTDFDGTYYNGTISEENLAAVRKFRGAGNLFGIASGRNCHETAVGILPLIGDDFDFVICANGAVCILPGERLLFEKYTSGKYLPTLLDCAKKYGAGRMFFDVSGCTGGALPDDSVFLAEGEESDAGLNLDMAAYVFGVGRKYGHARPACLSDFDSFCQCSIVYPDMERANEVCGVLGDMFADELEFHLAHTCIDITAAGVNKATGIADYADRMGVKRENIYTAGDSLNDMDMTVAYNGFVMANSCFPELIAAATDTIASVADGIYKAMK